MTADARQREAHRQQQMLQALWGRVDTLAGVAQTGTRAARGLRAYRDHAAAQAARALTVAYPTVAQAVGAEALAALAHALWQAEPPRAGDLAQWGGGLPALIAARPELADDPYLADCARLDWAVHCASRAADAPPGPPDLQPLLYRDPAALHLHLAPGTEVLTSAHPVVTIFRAHHGDAAARDAAFAEVRAARAAGLGETALVTRRGLRVAVRALTPAESAFTIALLDGRTLAQALHAAGDALDFAAWLREAVHEGLQVQTVGDEVGT